MSIKLALFTILLVLGYRTVKKVNELPLLWLRQAPDLGLDPTLRGLSGKIRRWHVEVLKRRRFQIEISPVEPGFSLTADSVGQRLVDPDWQVGDPYFDAQVRLSGDVNAATAVLTPETRRLATRLVTDFSAAVEDGRLTAQVDAVGDLKGALATLIELADCLQRPDAADMPGRLGQVATGRDRLNIRLTALHALKNDHRHSREAFLAASTLSSAPEIDLRMGATALLLGLSGEEQQVGVDIVRGILNDPFADVQEQLIALCLLIEDSDRAAALPVLSEWLQKPLESAELRREAIRACERRFALDPLLRMHVVKAAEHVQLINAVAEVGGAAGQPRILEGLAHKAKTVKLTAARALETVGDLEVIPPLVAALGAAEGDRALTRSIQAALAAIQRRAGVEQGGEVSIAALEPLEGSLSRVEAPEGGEVSLKESG